MRSLARGTGWIFLVALWMVPGGAWARMTAGSDPSFLVNNFCRLDFDGARLRSTADSASKGMIDNGESPEGPILLISGWQVLSSTITGNAADVTVIYKTVGSWGNEGQTLEFHSSEDQGIFHLKKDAAGWKISLDTLLVAPHVGAAALQRHLQLLLQAGLKSQSVSKADSDLRQRQLNQLKAYQSANPTPAPKP